MLTESADKTTQKIRVGEFEVRLESNASTGYEWSIAGQDKAFLQGVGEPRFIESDESAPGAPSVQAFSFRALKKGSTVLKLVYARPWEKEQTPAQTFWVRLDIE